MRERTIVDLEIDAPADRVWRALRTKDEVLQWFGWDHDGLDAEVEMIFFSGATADDDAHVLDTGDGVYRLEPAGARTRVTVSRTTAATGPDDEIDAGWIRFTGQLRAFVEAG